MNIDTLLDVIGDIAPEKVAEARDNRPKRRPLAPRPAVIAALLALCLLVSVPAMAAADVEPAYALVYAVAPAVAQRLKPVRLACRDNGIVMEVVAAEVHDDEANIYLAMRDTESDRIDATTDLFDSYTINRPFDMAGTCRNVSFDAETGTVYFLITLNRFGGRAITGSKITFSAREFLSGKEKFTAVLDSVSLADAPLSPAVQPLADSRGGSWPDEETAPARVLTPQAGFAFSPTPGVQVTAIGFTGGQLHVQAHFDDIRRTDNHGWFWLEDGETAIDPIASVSFWDEAQSGAYYEYIFDVTPDEAARCALACELTTSSRLTEGNWQVTFKVE